MVDPAVQGHGTLLAGLGQGAAAYVLDPSGDGVRQIAQILARHAGLSTISILAHGVAGALTLGSAVLDSDRTGFSPATLRKIGRALAPGGTLQLFACAVGEGAMGRAFVQSLSSAAGVAVAAASRALGGAAAGGNWVLDVRSSPKGRLSLNAAAPASLPIHEDVLAAYPHTLAGAGAPPAGFPLDVTDFSTTGTSFVRSGNAVINGTALQLTDTTGNQAGTAVYNQTFSSALGLSFTFTYNSSGGSGADGLSFFLLNGDTVASASSVTPGATGGSLGYADNSQAGITGGFLGIGFDKYGNYAQGGNGQTSSGISGGTADYVGVRGQGSGTTGYNWITGAPYAPGIDGTRTVQVNLVKIDSTHEQLQVFMEPSGSSTFTQVINTTVNQTLPSKFYFGFSASTGGFTDLHQIDDVAVALPVNLSFGAATVTDTTTGTTNPATLSPGHQFTYTYTLTNSGPNDDGQITVNDALPANITGSSWTVTDSAGTHAGTGSTIPVNLLNGANATITVSGTVDPNATSGNADHTITASAGAAYSFNNPNATARTGVALNIGHGGSSISLVGANQPGSTSDTAALAPFAGASVVDTYTDPSTGAPTDTLAVVVNPSAGTLSATGGTYDAATGTLSASGTAAQLQAVLRSLSFTPTAHAAAPGSTTPVALAVTVADTDPNNTTGGGHPSATQTATVSVTAAHDTPVIAGASANQPVGDGSTVAPFSTLTVTDPDQTGATAAVTISGGAANGSFTAASSSGWTQSAAQNGDVTYTKSVASQANIGAAVQAALRALVFQPTRRTSLTGATATATLSVAVTDTASPTPASATNSQTSVAIHDTTAPAAPTRPVLDAASDSGTRGDNRTNVTRPVLTGTAEAGSTVALADGSGAGAVALGTATVDSTGRWSLAPAAALAEGAHSITATDTDTGGNTSPASPSLALTIDTTPPAAPVSLALTPASDSGTRGDNRTNVAAPTLTGVAEAGSTVTLTDGTGASASLLGATQADSTGHWSLTSSTLAEGAHSITATATDAAGNVSAASAAFPLSIDTTAPAAPPAPALAVASDSGATGDGRTNVATPILTGTAEAGSTVTLTDGTGGNAVVLGTVQADGAGRWSLTPAAALAEGAHAITAVATDAAGNASPASGAFALTIDTTPPPVPPAPVLASASDSGTRGDGLTNIAAPTLTGTAEANSTVTLTDGSGSRAAVLGTARADGAGQWSFASPALTDGTHAVTATATDAAGNVSAASAALALTIDTALPAAPPAPALAPASDSGTVGDGVTNAAAPVLTGTAEAGSTVTVTDGTGGNAVVLGTAPADGAGLWSLAGVTLAEGVHSITAAATDAAGNASPASPALALTIDRTAPAAPNTPALGTGSDSGTQGDGITNVVRPVLAGTAEANSTVTLTDGSGAGAVVLGVARADGTGQWSFASPTLAEGAHSVTATATDAAGNVSAASGALALTVDATAPAAPVGPVLSPASDSGAQGDNRTNLAAPALTGTAEANSTVTLTDGVGSSAVVLGRVQADGAGQWSFTPGAPLAEGAHSIAATATDAAGNVSAASAALPLTIDTTAPTVPSAPALAAASDSGAQGDGITNVAAPILDGTAEPGSTVRLTDGAGNGAVVLGAVQADGAGHWSFASPALLDGLHGISATATDAAGNVSAASSALALTVDTAPPRTPTSPALAVASDSGAKGDGLTNVAAPTLTGTAEANSTVTLTDGSGSRAAVLGTAQADGAGQWSLTPATILAEGAHSITATAADAAGNVSAASAAFALTIDTTAPTVPSAPALAPASDSGAKGDGLTNVAAPTLAGTAEANSTVTLTDGTGAGAVVLGTAQADAAGQWSFVPGTALTDGAHAITASAADAAGNVSAASAALALAIDTAAPVITRVSTTPAGGTALRAGQAVAFALSASEAVRVDAASGSPVLLLSNGGTATYAGSQDGGSTLLFAATTAAGQDSPDLKVTGLNLNGAAIADAAGNPANLSGLPVAAGADTGLVIDTAPPTVTMALRRDTGTLATDNTTADATLTGTAEAGGTVTISEAGAVLGTAPVDGTGHWTFAPQGLADGSHAVVASEADRAGNLGTARLGFTLDTVPPAAPAGLALAPDSDSGAKGDGVTNVAAPILTGTAEAGSTVTLRDGSGAAAAVIGATEADAAGHWSLTSPVLADGDHHLSATATDAAGNVSPASDDLSLVIDTAAPAFPGTPALDATSDTGTQSDGITSTTRPLLTGTAEPNSTVTLLDGTGSGAVVLGSVTADRLGRWGFAPSVPLAEGAHAIAATATDAAGNVSGTPGTARTLAVTIDTTAPSAPSAPALATGSDSGVLGDGTTRVTAPILTGTAEAGSTVALLDGTVRLGTAQVDLHGRWSFRSPALTDGVHTITAIATDAAGNASDASPGFALTIDDMPPTAPTALALTPGSDSGAKGDGLTNTPRPTLTGTAEAGSTVVLSADGVRVGTVQADGSGRWSLTLAAPLGDGAHRVTATATDAAGNTSAASNPLALTIISVPPPAPAGLTLAPASDSGAKGDGTTNATRPTLTGAAAPGSTVTLTDGSGSSAKVLGSTLADASGRWSFATPALTNGEHGLTATATDAAGNVSPASSPFTLTIDDVAPAVTAALANDTGPNGDGTTSDPALTGTADPGATVALSENGKALGTAIADAAGKWSFTPTDLADGPHAVLASDTDAAGNTGTATVGFVLDTAPPPSTDYTVTNGSGVTSDGAMTPYHGTVPGVARQFVYRGTGNATIVARAGDALLQGGGGNDAIAAQSGRNVLDGAGGSDWLVGGTGQDSFIVDARSSGSWSTVVGFKAGDDVAIRNLGGTLSTFHWDGVDGHGGYQGATLRGTVAGTGEAFSVTFAGLSPADADKLSAVVETGPDGTPSLHLTSATPAAPGDGATYGITDTTTGASATGMLDAYHGSTGGLLYQHLLNGDNSVILVAHASDAFLKSGAGTDAIVVRNGDNVLDGGTGSNWLVGGAGHDTFFVDARGERPVWDTVLNFHAGDSLTLWGYQAGVSNWSWTDAVEGAKGYEGATLRGAMDGKDVDFSVTLAGLSPSQGRGLAVTSGTTNDGQGYLHVQA